MRSVCFRQGNEIRFGLRQGDQVDEINDPSIASVNDVLSALMEGRRPSTGAVHVFEELDLLPPVPRPGKILCIGLNYVDHAKESGHAVPDYPAVFMRGPSSLTGHNHPLLRPVCSDRFDYEAELAIVIGRSVHAISERDALNFVAGYACFNDGSLRDYQMKSGQWTMGKNFDQTGGFGPDLVTPDELPEGAAGLRVVTRLNGQVLQDGNTSNMIFSVAKIIEILSEVMTLEPGDVIITGTPAGVGFARTPPIFMQAGDVCEIEIEQIGTLRNAIVDAAF